MDKNTHWYVWIQPVLNKKTNKWEVELCDEQNTHIKTSEYETQELANEGIHKEQAEEIKTTGTR